VNPAPGATQHTMMQMQPLHAMCTKMLPERCYPSKTARCLMSFIACNTMQHKRLMSFIACNTMQQTATQALDVFHRLQHTATHCNTSA